MKEKYIPSSEETKKAEEMMTKKEKIMSSERDQEYDYLSKDIKKGKELIKNLKEGKYNLKMQGNLVDNFNAYLENPESCVRLFGKIGDDQIDIMIRGGEYIQQHKIFDNLIKGTINNKQISREEAQDIFETYKKVAHLQDDSVYERRAESEMAGEALDKYTEEGKRKWQNYLKTHYKKMKDEESEIEKDIWKNHIPPK